MGMRVGSGKLSFKVAYNGGRPDVEVLEKPDDSKSSSMNRPSSHK